MPYCTVEDIEAYYLNKEFKCNSYVSEKEVDSFIIQDTALINSYLNSRYVLPIKNTDDLLILKAINEKLVVGTIDDIFREKTQDGDFQRTRGYRKEATELLTKIKNGEVLLLSTQKTAAMKFNNIDSNGNEVQKRFKDSQVEPTFTTLDRERRTYVSS